MSNYAYISPASSLSLTEEDDVNTPLLSGDIMGLEDKTQHDVSTSNALSGDFGSSSSGDGSEEKKAPWWSYIWVGTSVDVQTAKTSANQAFSRTTT